MISGPMHISVHHHFDTNSLFLDLNNSAQVISRGIGLDDDFNTMVTDKVRISGKGFQPQRYAVYSQSNFEQGEFQDDLLISGRKVCTHEQYLQ